ncbi:MAG TPA: glycosyltransferase family 39 protein, partial [Acidimicrobiia bacterium]|nr:glycosyltransferase family 39 protein [Acidimicrobiia bacterium]
IAWLVGLALIGPWVAYNMTRFNGPVFITTGIGSTTLQGNCDSTYSGRLLGYHDLNCVDSVARAGDESQVENRRLRAGLDYAKDHASQVPKVVAARIGRVFDVFRPLQNAVFNILPEGRTRFESYAGLWSYWALLIPGAVGLVALRRRRYPIWPLLTTVVIVVVTAATAYAITRYRVPVEVALVAAAGVGVDRAIAWVRSGDARRGAEHVAALGSAQFTRALLVVTGGGLLLRVAFAISRRHRGLGGDAYWYYWQARALADGHFFINPLAWRTLGVTSPSAGHAPLYPAYLAILPLLGITAPLAMRLASCLLGAATIYVIGRAACRIAGPRAGLLAAALAAVAPALWINDAMLLSESMYALTIALVVWAAYVFWETPTTKHAAFLGGALALAAYARPEALGLAVLLALTWLVAARGRPWRERLARLAVLGGVVVLALAPWVVRNLVAFDKTVTVSDSQGTVLATANCDSTYHGRNIGLYDLGCLLDDLGATPEQRTAISLEGGPGLGKFLYLQPGDESTVSARLQHDALHYISQHPARASVVSVVRVARAWNLLWPRAEVRFDAFVEGRGLTVSWLALIGYWVTLALAVWGFVAMRRRRIPIGPLLAVCVMAALTVAVSIGLTRYRVGADVALIVAAGVALDTLAERLPTARAAPAPERVPSFEPK